MTSARELRPRSALALVALLFVVLALLVAGLTPPWEANDEPDHVQNVETLVSGHLYRIERGSGAEPHQPPLYYLALAGWQRALGLGPFRPAPVYGCNFFVRRCKHVFRHDIPADGSDQRHVMLLRLPGVLLGCLAVLLTALAARRITADPWTPVVAAATVAFVPRFVFLSGVVNNDNLANALAGAATVLALVAVTGRRRDRRARVLLAASLGVVLGLLLLTKETALSLAPGMLIAAYLSGRNRRDGLCLAGVLAAVALLVGSPWLIHNAVAYGDPLALARTHQYLGGLSVVPGHGALIFLVGPPLEVIFQTAPRTFFRGFWYESGWTAFRWPWWAYVPFWLLTFGALSGLTWGRSRTKAPRGDRRRAVLIVLVALVLVPVATFWALGLSTNTAQARLVFVGLPAFGCLIALGLEGLALPVAARFALPALGAIGTMIAIRQDVVRVPPAAVATGAVPPALVCAAGCGREDPSARVRVRLGSGRAEGIA